MLTLTHPGKLGDLLWSLPVIRQYADISGGPVGLYLAASCLPLRDLLQLQPYIAEVVVDHTWHPPLTAPLPYQPPVVLPDSINLGYRSWPSRALPYQHAIEAFGDDGYLTDFSPPWLPNIPRLPEEDLVGPIQVVFHFTDRWLELKVGLVELLKQDYPFRRQVWRSLITHGPGRWSSEYGGIETTFLDQARFIQNCKLVVTDNSAVMVLAAALGKRCLVVEPETDRHHFIFWPGSHLHDDGCSTTWRQADNPFGKLIYPVLGTDSRPTFDARHVRDAIRQHLAEVE